MEKMEKKEERDGDRGRSGNEDLRRRRERENR